MSCDNNSDFWCFSLLVAFEFRIFSRSLLVFAAIFPIMRMEDYSPQCCCGNGRMVLLRVGRSARNAGRYYYKCPLYHDHHGSFKWFDEWAAFRNHSGMTRLPKIPNRPLVTSKRDDDLSDVPPTRARHIRHSIKKGSPPTTTLVIVVLVLLVVGFAIGMQAWSVFLFSLLCFTCKTLGCYWSNLYVSHEQTPHEPLITEYLNQNNTVTHKTHDHNTAKEHQPACIMCHASHAIS